MTSFEDIKRRNSQIEFLVKAKYPLHKAYRAAKSTTNIDALAYIQDADAYQARLLDLAKSKPDEFASLVVDTELSLLGPLHTLEESADFIATTLYKDNGYDQTQKRLRCAEDYREILRSRVLNGSMLFINPHIKKPFDHTRLSIHDLPSDGLIPENRLYTCLRPIDSAYAKEFPRPPTPAPQVSKAPPPINPITGSYVRPPSIQPPPVVQAPSQPAVAAPAPSTTSSAKSEDPPGGGNSVKAKLWKLADEVANSIRVGSDTVSLNAVCKQLCKDHIRTANKDLLNGQKGWHTESWLKEKGRLQGWEDPTLRK